MRSGGKSRFNYEQKRKRQDSVKL